MHIEQILKNVKEEGIQLSIALLILPVLFVLYNAYFGLGGDNIWETQYSYVFLILIALAGIALSVRYGNKSGLWAFAPLGFYLLHAVGISDGFWQMILEYLSLLLILYSFCWLVYKGHVRSWFFLLLLIYSFLVYGMGFTFLLALTYVFFYFIFLVFKDNITVFTTLGKEKSVRYLAKSFLYWSPILILIIPIKYAQKKIEKTIKNQIYTHTLVDSTQFLLQQEFTDSLFNDLRPNKHQTTILFVDRSEKKEEEPLVETETMAMAPMKASVINEIDLQQVLVDDTLAYDIITHVLPKYDSLQKRYSNIYLNQTFSSVEEEPGPIHDFELITNLKENGELDFPFVLVLQDLSFEQADKSIDKLQPNFEISSLIALKRLELSMIQSIETSTAEIDFSVLERLDEIGEQQLEIQRKKIEDQIIGHQNKTLGVVEEKFNSFFPEPFLKTEKCKFWEIGKLVSNGIKRNVNKQYKREKEKAKTKIDNKIKAVYQKLINKINYQFKKASQKIKDLSDDVNPDELLDENTDITAIINGTVKTAFDEVIKELMGQLQLIFGGIFFYSLIGAIAFYFLVVQTFLYIFARLSISKQNNLFATLNTTDKVLPKGSIKKCGDGYTIAASEKQTYYVSRKFEPSGRPPKFIIPFKGLSIYRRLRASAYFMNKIDMTKGSGSVQFRAIGSSEFVEWALKEGEEVVFDYKNFVAITDSVKLKSDISFRVTTLILGKLFYHVAQGPGKLILMTKGRPIVSGEKSSNASLAQNRILAWNKGTNFDIDTELGLTDVYLSGFYLQKKSNDLIIIDADAEGKAKLGLIQYIKGLIWPF